MKLFYRLILLLLAGLVLFASCSEDDFDRKPLLKLSKNEVNFTKTAGSESIVVTKNDTDEFLYTITNNSSSEDWIVITKGETGFKIAVADNTKRVDRTATIKVLLLKGNLEETVAVTQAAEDLAVYSVSESQLNFSYDEESSAIYIETNTGEDWVLSENSVGDWLSIDLSEKAKGKIVVKASATSETEAREAEIKIVFPGKTLTIAVSQRGILHFDFPLLEIGYNYGDTGGKPWFKYPDNIGNAAAFEQSRGSVWQSTTQISYAYTTTSTIFPTVSYSIYDYYSEKFYTIKAAFAKCPNVKPFALLDDPKFLEYLSYNGFEFAYRNDTKNIAVYWNAQKEIAVQFCNYDSPASTGNRLSFVHSRVRPDNEEAQTNSYPTLDAMPLPFMEWPGTAIDIAEWEAKTGSTLLAGSTELLKMYTPNKTKEPFFLERAYYLDDAVQPAALKKVTMVFTKVDLAFYTTGYYLDSNGYAMTNEFKALLEKEGFVHYKTNTSVGIKHHHYSHAEKGISMDIHVFGYVDEMFVPRLTITITPYVAP